MDKFSERVHQVVDPELAAIRDLLIDSDNKQGEIPGNAGISTGIKGEVNAVEHRLEPSTENGRKNIFLQKLKEKIQEKAVDAIVDLPEALGQALSDALQETLPAVISSIGTLGGAVLDTAGDVSDAVISTVAQAIIGTLLGLKLDTLLTEHRMLDAFIREKLNKLQSQRAADRAYFQAVTDEMDNELQRVQRICENLEKDINNLSLDEKYRYESIVTSIGTLYDFAKGTSDIVGALYEKILHCDSEISDLKNMIRSLTGRTQQIERTLSGITKSDSNPNFGLVASMQNFQRTMGTIYGPRGLL